MQQEQLDNLEADIQEKVTEKTRYALSPNASRELDENTFGIPPDEFNST